ADRRAGRGRRLRQPLLRPRDARRWCARRAVRRSERAEIELTQARILRPEEVDPASGRDETHWVGPLPDLRRLSEALGTDALQINVLFFESGVRSRPHTHPYDQVL